MKRKVMLMWILFVVCVITTLVLRYFLERQDVEFEEVTVTVVSAEKKELENRKTNTTLTINDVKVEYEGEEYALKNAYDVYMYPTGKEVTAYLSHGKLYANIAGVESSTLLYYVYLAFLIASFIMFGVAINESIQARRR
ncbi:MAG: penicillin-binding protein [Lachnospiraceae bacterium]|nr:penicillin-binding protein [Lachnospiraceae bacterium]MCI8972797.1 penicillin-binding protein [Lachnospiraceae bacterium]